MATRINTLAASQSLFVTPQPLTGNANIPASQVRELTNITTFGWQVQNNLDPVYVLGQRAPVTRDSTDPPEFTFNFDYNITSFDNENRLGFVTDGTSGCLSKIINGQEDEKIYFNSVAPYGVDNFGSVAGNNSCLSFGNGVISSYSFQAQVGSIPSVTINGAALNARSHIDSVSEPIPSLDVTTGLEMVGTFTLPTASGAVGRDAIIRPGDVVVDFGNVSGLFYNLSGLCVQSIGIDFDLGREARNCLGNRYARAREVNPQVDVTTSITFQAPDLISGSAFQYFCQTGIYNANVTMRRPACNSTGTQVVKFDIRGMRLSEEDGSVAQGTDGTTITCNFVSSIGSANDLINNLYMSGSAT